MGGAARFRAELIRYLARSGREDVQVIGADRRARPGWLLRREFAVPARARRVALNNVSFVAPGGERWTLLGNALHFLAGDEMARLDSSLRPMVQRQTAVVRLAARRSDMLVAPCTAMAERVRRAVPGVSSRVVVRFHPVSADAIPVLPREPAILCPVIFQPYKHMAARLTELLAVLDEHGDPTWHLLVTAHWAEVPAGVARHPRVRLLGHLPVHELSQVGARACAVFFPSGLESFGYPLAEARASGRPVIALDTPQNREIAGPALCGFTVGDAESLRQATKAAMTTEPVPDPGPFGPGGYFDWMLGAPR